MALELTALHGRVLDARGHVLVTGGPGSGKTTLALLKAKDRIEDGLEPGQSVLFLSFSRAAVARVMEAARVDLPRGMGACLVTQTFHSFFWDLLRTHAYLLGTPKCVRLLLPHDEAVCKAGYDGDEAGWMAERERLSSNEGRVAFDLFAPKTHELLSGSRRLRDLVSSRFPLMVIDEAQDTSKDQWDCIRVLATQSQLVCLADLEQQIYDYRPDVSAERVTEIMEELNPTRVDLAVRNHRSRDREILAFGNDILRDTPRGAPYVGVRKYACPPKAADRDKAIRSSVGRMRGEIAAVKGAPAEGIAVLATWRRGVAIVARALSGGDGDRRISHYVLIDEPAIALSGRLIAFLLEPGDRDAELMVLATALELGSDVLRAKGGASNLRQAETLRRQAAGSRGGRAPGGATVGAKLLRVLGDVRANPNSGDPKCDWLEIRRRLKDSGCGTLVMISETAEDLFMLGRGRRISDALVEAWQATGAYEGARARFDAALAEEQILSGFRDWDGLTVMTLHQSKGKEFDGVIIFEDQNNCPLVMPKDQAPFPRSRRLLRVGVTRARYQVAILQDVRSVSPILQGHRL